jgi:hypothetical protein
MASGAPPNTGQKAKPEKAKPLSPKEQSARFIEAARDLGVDESGDAFERAMTVITAPSGAPKASR